MNAIPAGQASKDFADEVQETLISHCRLSPEQVSYVTSQMRHLEVDFAQAAIALNVVTQNEADNARTWVQQLEASQGSSVIETALRRRSLARTELVKHVVAVRPSSQLIIAHDQDNPRSEGLRALRTQLLLLNDARSEGQTVALVSPGAGEGRSQLAAELAIAYSQMGNRTLLVDADLRRPRQHILFNADNKWGLAQALARGGSQSQHLGVEGLPNLSLLTSGEAVPNPLELISGGRFEPLMYEWRKNYDFVVFDSPPLEAYADALAIAKVATRVLVLCRTHLTPHSRMKEALRRLSTTRAQILGAVVNDF